MDIAEHTVLFTSKLKDGTLGLGGSMRHMVGHTGDSPFHVFHSFGFSTMISDLLRRDTIPEELISFDFHLPFIHDACNRRHGPVQQLEFLAIRLAEGYIDSLQDDSSKARVIIGTPLYVAMS